ncbi:S-layer homology domain-containing protein [Desulfoscipio sp. XC116]|uniref:S-layer homology domain-containing protein n=1 Tax=Desulfoscipio sp. XC116 TaxID=3144975 RepID=UPI00325ABCB6
MIKKIMTTILLMMFCLLGTAAAPASAETVSDALDALVEYYEVNKPQPDYWEEIVGLGRAGAIDRFDLSAWQADPDGSALNYASTILALGAAGQDPQNYIDRDGNNINLVEQLAAKQKSNGSFGDSINNTAYAILALDRAGGSYRVSDALNYLVNQQKNDGGFSISGSSGDPDTTGLTMMALAEHTVNASVYGSVYGALDYLRAVQLDSGGFASFGSENTESIASVIQGLLACGEDITTWNKGDNNIINAMFNFRLADGSFSHLPGGRSNDIATRQALMALADLKESYGSFVVVGGGSGGENPGTSKIKVRVEGLRNTLASGEVELDGTALDALKILVGNANVLLDSNGMISTILTERGDSGSDGNTTTSWLYYIVRNGELDASAVSTGPGGYNVAPGDEVVFYIGAYAAADWSNKTFIPVINITPANPTAGQTLIVNVSGTSFDWGENDFTTTLLDPVTVDFNGETYETSFGQTQIPLTAAGTFTLKVYKQHPDGYPELVRSSRQITVGEALNKQVKVRVEGAAGQLASGTVEVGGTALDALGALVGKANVAAPGGYITSILGESENPGFAEDTALSWKYYVLRNGDIESSSPGTGAGSYNVAAGDEVIFYLGAYDTGTYSDKTYLTLIGLQPQSPKDGQSATVTITVKKYDWLTGLTEQQVNDIKLIINGQEQIVSSGQPVSFTAVEGPLNIRAEKYDQPGYPQIVPGELALNVKAQGGEGGEDDSITVILLVRGKDRELLYSGTVQIAGSEDRNPIYALKQTSLRVGTRYNDSYVYSIDGIAEDSGSTAGWKYKVNGAAPESISGKDYELENGDEVEWYWAQDPNDPGNGSVSSGELAKEIPPVPAERAQAVKQARERVAEEMGNLAQLLPESAPKQEELFHRIELAECNPVVVPTDYPMTLEEREKWMEILQENKVQVSQPVDPDSDNTLTDLLQEVYLSLPGGSINSRVTVEIYELSGPDSTIPDTHRQVSSVYELGPDGLTFDNPVTLRIKIAGYEGTPENLVIAWYDAANDRWVPVPSVVDPANEEISGLITHFTNFAVLAREKQPVSFPDVGNGSYDWAQKEIQYLALKGILSDTGEGNFEPARPVTRGEFIVMLAKAMGIEAPPGGNQIFTDLEPDTPHYDILQAAYTAGLVRGYDDGTIRTDEQITREQIAAILTRALDLEPVAAELEFSDRDKVGAWARDSVAAAAASGLLKGFPDGSFKPDMLTDRAQSAVLVYRILSLN